jgi:diguanylate cyclase (GGDEF)-like protein
MTQSSRVDARRVASLLIPFFATAAFGWLGLWAGGWNGDFVVAVWPAGGTALVAMLLLGRSVWPAIFLGSVVPLVLAGGNVVWSTISAAGLTIGAGLGSLLVERLARGTQAFERPQSILRAAVIVAATSGISALAVALATSTVAHDASGAFIWVTWWLASLGGTLIVAPVLLLWMAAPLGRIRLLPAFEALVLLGGLSLVALVVFAGRLAGPVQNYPLEFLCVPFLLWAAFRLGPRTVSLAAAVLCGTAIWGTMHGFGPFARASVVESTLLVQAYMVVVATMAAVIAAVVSEHRRATEQLGELATTDPLTGIANYRRLLDVLRFEIARSNRTGRPFSILFLDMDGLKAINDAHGHLAGSRALCMLADTLRMSVRAIDTPTRYGGDEFAVVLPETAEAGGYTVLRRITERLAQLPGKIPISVSGGVAVFPRDGASPTQLLRSADKLLYEAKEQAAATRRRHATGLERPGTAS